MSECCHSRSPQRTSAAIQDDYLRQRGEFHGYAAIEAAHPVTCYFATPYHSWERGTNENTNGLIRQYNRKGQSLESVTQAECDFIAHELDTRPRKRHDYKTPQKVYYSRV